MSFGMQGEIGDEEFKEYFSQYGDIEDSVVSWMSASPLAAFAPCMRASIACRPTLSPRPKHCCCYAMIAYAHAGAQKT
jgi:hypothetical protein